jgi:hypothetical protein
MPRSPLKFNYSFGAICRLHLNGRISRTRYQRESTSRLRQHVPAKRRLTFNGLHCVISKKTILFSNINSLHLQMTRYIIIFTEYCVSSEHVFVLHVFVCDRLCGLVVRVLGYRSWGPGFDSWHYQIFSEVVSLERGSLSLVRITGELLEWKSSGSCLENRD